MPLGDPNNAQCGALPKPGSSRTWPCKNIPVLGSERCRMHGGNNVKTRKAKQQAKVRKEAAKAIRKLKIAPVENPLLELSRLAGEAVAWKNEMNRQVHELTGSVGYRGEHAEQIKAVVQLFEHAISQCSSILVALAKLNIDERLAAIKETQAEMLRDAMLAAFEEAGLEIRDVDKKRRVAAAFTGKLRLITDEDAA